MVGVVLTVLVLSVPALAGRRGRGRAATDRPRFAPGMRGGQRMGAFAQNMRRHGPYAGKGQYCPFGLGPYGWGQGRGMAQWGQGFQGRGLGRGGQAYGRRGMMQRGRPGRRGGGMGRGGQAYTRGGMMQRGPMMGPGRRGGAMGRGGQAFGRRGMMQRGPMMGPGRQDRGMVRGDRGYQGRRFGPYGQGFEPRGEGWGAMGGWQRGFRPGGMGRPDQDLPPTPDVEKPAAPTPRKDMDRPGPPVLRRGGGMRGQGFQGGIPELRRRGEGPRKDTPPDAGARRRRPRPTDEEPDS